MLLRSGKNSRVKAISISYSGITSTISATTSPQQQYCSIIHPKISKLARKIRQVRKGGPHTSDRAAC
uniref:Uncharacterized protein n=1 Tax=Arundo donax TaxID=35708 RepID=A0A0A9ENE6_ARUDO